MCDPALCNAIPPPCPEGTVAAIDDGCYSGGCIQEALCAP
jgi:hypothetical protein